MSSSGVRARKRTSVTRCAANETRRSCPPRLKDEVLLQELRLKQSSSSESRDKRSGHPSSSNGFAVEKARQPLSELLLSAAGRLDKGDFRGKSELDEHGGDDELELLIRLRTTSGSNLIAVMVSSSISSRKTLLVDMGFRRFL